MSDTGEVAQQAEEESASIAIGKKLAGAREQQELSQQELARKLNLTVRKLDDLEHGRFEQLGAVIFVRGYIKAYCKIVALDPAPLLSAFEPEPQAQEQASMQSFSRRTEKEAHDNRLMLFSYAILAIILGSSLFWWWQDSDEPVVETTPLAADIVAAPAQETEQPSLVEDNSEAVSEKESEQSQQENPQQSASEPSETADTPRPNQDVVPVDNDDTAQSTSPAEEPLAKAPLAEAPLAAGEQRVVMRFSGECWVEVHDAKGQRLAYDIKQAGQELELVGLAPFAVTLGKHDVVSISVNGQAVDISQFPKNRLAKFSLPLTE
ncbi:RodZ domain-containing protein [Pseudoalteromonas sp. T1lg75]|uniref:RodZ domain-containing protein n=1 Tax=Pseudoalteromonas sp. T1lg75 TaxID=2077102 RepID=UPI000CF6F02A|nr:RodZ family helix-turn-helix domain-containing protein [Pseudoalteromonas sp. T1lg75]